MATINNIEVTGELSLLESAGNKSLVGILTAPNPMVALGLGLAEKTMYEYIGSATINGVRKKVKVPVFINQVSDQSLRVTSSGQPTILN